MGDLKYEQTISNSSYPLEEISIRIALLTKERVWESRDIDFFLEILLNYQWIVGDKKYSFDLETLSDKDIIMGRLIKNNYDVLVIPGASVGDAEAYVRWAPIPRNWLWKNNIDNFVRNGGGFFSVCGGTMLLTDLDYRTKSFFEHMYEKTRFDATCVKMHFDKHTYVSIPIPRLFFYLWRSQIPCALIYSLYGTGWDISDFNNDHRGGTCLDYQINTSHPIFNDYLEESRRIRWISGPALSIPENTEREVSVIAKYPIEEISDNESTKIYLWRYTGGFIGMIKGLFLSLKDRDKVEFSNIFSGALTHAEDWIRLDKIVETNLSNKPAITAEIYPNKNRARLVLSAPHLERNVWWGGRLKEAEDTDHNNIFDGFYNWVNITPNPIEHEWTYNYWANRRCVAWVAKIPDNDLPPVYGPSQVKDFDQYIQHSTFRVNGIAEASDGDVSLDLYYRYSNDNSSWGNWTFYNTDHDDSNGWSWDFISPKGAGYYQFYSIRHVVSEYEEIYEKLPPGPDAIAYSSLCPP